MSKSNVPVKQLAIIITALFGFWMIFEYFLNIPVMKNLGAEFSLWSSLLISFFLAIGLVNTSTYHLKKARTSKDMETKVLSTYFLALLFIATIIGLIFGTNEGPYPFLYNSTFMYMYAFQVGIPGFYTFSAALKAYKVRNLESLIFLVAGVLVLLANAPATSAMMSGVDVIGLWIVDIPLVAFNRAMQITMGVGLVAYCIRTLMGERTE